MNEYANNDHWEWVARLRKDIEMSSLGKEVANIIGYVGYGIYNAPIDYKKIEWDNDIWVEVDWKGDLANWDFDRLTKLILECHKRMIRISIEAKSKGILKMYYHKRKGREGMMNERMPTIEEMIERRKIAFGEKEPTNDTNHRE